MRMNVEQRWTGLKRKSWLASLLVTLLLIPNLVTAQDATQTKSENAAAQEPASPSKTKKPTAYWPEGVDFDPSIPTPKEFFGFNVGFRHLNHAQVAGYVKKLAEVSDRITVQQMAETHGGRPCLLATITSDANRNRLNKIQASHRKLTKRNANQVEIENLPAVINMGYGVHGDESSATNCSPLVLHYLAAAQGEEIEAWLENCVILLDPSLNPDGFNRFANWANRYRGRVLNPDPQHAEHNQQWPPGRVNYYWFDLNRDWLPLVHPESHGRMKWFHQWKPNVVLDFHEMGTNSTYFFQPGIPERKNPLTPMRNLELTGEIAKFHSKDLDKQGKLYFTQERFDDFYMGKGSTYPDLHGSVGILFEQASSRGHVQKNQDGLLRFHDTISNQFTSSLSSLKATTALRKELLEYKREFYQDSLAAAAKNKVQTFVFSCPHNRTRLVEFSKVLLRHDIRCGWLKEDFEYGDRTFDAKWTLVVPANQPEFRFIKSLLMRRTRFKENIFYDVSSWTLSLAYGVNQTGLSKKIDSEKLIPAKLQPKKTEAEFSPEDDDIAYMMDWRDDVAPIVLAKLMKADINARVSTKTYTMSTGPESSKKFGLGTIVVALGVQKNKRAAIHRILKFAVKNGADVTAVKSGLAEQGVDLGSSSLSVIKKPTIAMLVGPGTSAYTAGATWHQLDHRMGLPVTLIKKSSLGRADLSTYTTLILPTGSFDGDEWKKIDSFAASGGTVIATGSSATSIAPRAGQAVGSSSVAAEGDDSKGSIQEPFDSQSNRRALQLISGAIFRTKIDRTHPLMYGFSNSHLPMFRNHASFLRPSSNAYGNPAIYDAENPLMAGYCSDENVERFKGSASIVVSPRGRGRFILMADSPNFRGFWRATSRVFMNAVYFGDKVDP